MLIASKKNAQIEKRIIWQRFFCVFFGGGRGFEEVAQFEPNHHSIYAIKPTTPFFSLLLQGRAR